MNYSPQQNLSQLDSPTLLLPKAKSPSLNLSLTAVERCTPLEYTCLPNVLDAAIFISLWSELQKM